MESERILHSFHDECLESVNIDYNKKNVSFVLYDLFSNDWKNIEFNEYSTWIEDYFAKYTVLFLNCIYFEGLSFDIWGRGNNIMYIEVMNITEKSVKDFVDRELTTSELENAIKLNEFIGIKVTLNSGNNIAIICEQIIFNDDLIAKKWNH